MPPRNDIAVRVRGLSKSYTIAQGVAVSRISPYGFKRMERKFADVI